MLPKDGTFTEYLITVMNIGGGFNCSLEFFLLDGSKNIYFSQGFSYLTMV